MESSHGAGEDGWKVLKVFNSQTSLLIFLNSEYLSFKL